MARVEPETRDAVTITFAIPQALQAEYCFRPGQHLTLKARLGGEELRRCYSICHSRTPGEISIAVKAIDGGRFSRYAQHDIQQGMELEVMVPQGHFGYQPQAERQGEYLAIAAGSGITPMMAIISATLATEPQSRFTLIYGNRSSHSMMFRQALADLKDRYPQRLQEFCGIKAWIIQHEYDHLEGILFTDHLSALKKRILKNKLNNISTGKFKPAYRVILPK